MGDGMDRKPTVLEQIRQDLNDEDYLTDDDEKLLLEFAELYSVYHASRTPEAHAAVEDFFKAKLAVEAK
jgi:hypothetical protein